MARSRSHKKDAQLNPLEQWERELLGYDSPRPPRGTRADRRRNETQVARRQSRSRLNRRPNTGKPKTAAQAQLRRASEAQQKRSGITSSGTARKSRRALKRELYGAVGARAED